MTHFKCVRKQPTDNEYAKRHYIFRPYEIFLILLDERATDFSKSWSKRVHTQREII